MCEERMFEMHCSGGAMQAKWICQLVLPGVTYFLEEGGGGGANIRREGGGGLGPKSLCTKNGLIRFSLL